MFWFFGHEACGIFAPQPGIEPAPAALEGKVLTTGPSGKCLFYILSNEMNILVECISQCFHAKPGQSSIIFSLRETHFGGGRVD